MCCIDTVNNKIKTFSKIFLKDSIQYKNDSLFMLTLTCSFYTGLVVRVGLVHHLICSIHDSIQCQCMFSCLEYKSARLL